jgi:RimJ/RimL family protein N-acetyltransferase
MTEEHLASTYRWLSESAELRREVDCLDTPTIEGNRACWHSRWQESSREDYAVLTAAGKHIGNCGLCEIDLQRRKAQLWIYLGESQGKGYGTLAVRQLLERGFRDLGLNRIFLRVVADNDRALRLYRGLGFVQEGCRRQDTVWEGRYVDSILMGLLAQDYRTPDGPKGGQ